MGRCFVYLFVLSYIASCSKYREDIDNLNNGEIWKMGHGGMGISNAYPMNSRESLIRTLRYDMDGTEIDVQLTKDNVLVAFHDQTMDSKTNFSGRINDYTWEELKDARYTITPNQRFEIVRLTDFFAMPETHDKRFCFDIKLNPSADMPSYLQDFENEFLNLVSFYGLEERCIVESSSVLFLNDLKIQNPDLELFYYPGTTFDDGMSVTLNNGFDGITISYKELSKEKVKQAHLAGIKVATWNVNSKKENKEAVSYHPDIIETDEVKFLSRYLR